MMFQRISRALRFGALACLVGGGLALAGASERAPIAVALGLATTLWPLGRAWRGARRTALGAAVIWAGLAVGLGLVSQAVAWSEPLATGRPLAGQWTYLSALATLAALISVLNARTPGGGAWAILMVLLVLVFLIPWLEGPWMARNVRGLSRLRLGTPWTLFYALLVVAGVTNFLPTRYGPAAAWLAAGFAVEYLGLTQDTVVLTQRGRLWSAFPWMLAAAVWTADGRSRLGLRGAGGLERVWFWFRDHWGVVWALRVQERFNRAAGSRGWPIRLGWFGVVPAPGLPPESRLEVPEAAEATLKGLLRRFAEPGRIDAAVAITTRASGE